MTADSTDESTTVANPDGSFTYTATQPTQVEQNGTWVPVDPTLHQNADGTLAPNAAASSVVFSGGGSSPLVTLTSSTGEQMSLSWPSALPAPTLSGATATYTNVYPGVNLAMTATASGGYTEQLIITSATAAADPALADIHFITSTNGLTLSTDAADGLQAVDASGDTVFASPTATMWSTPAAATSTADAANTRMSTAAAPSTRMLAAAAPSTDLPADATQDDDGPTTTVGVQVTGNSLDLQPPASALTGSNVTYPIVIDPTVSPAIEGNDWTWVSETNSSISYWRGSNDDYKDGSDGKVGYDDWCASSNYTTGGCPGDGFGRTRSLFSMDMSHLAGKHVTKATFTVYEQGATSSWTGSRQIDLHGAGAFSNSTTWSNQPNVFTAYTPSSLVSIDSNGVGSGVFDATTLIQNAVAAGYQTQTMELQADNEYDDTAYRYILSSGQYIPALSVTYYSTPDIPSDLSITNGSKSYPCNTTGGIDTAAPGYWINANDAKSVTFNATISTPDTSVASTALTSDFWVHETNPTPAAHWTDLGGQTINSQAGGTVTHPPTALAIADGETFQWQVYASEDSGSFSSTAAPSTSDSCWFSVDLTPPTLGTSPTAAPPSTVGGVPGSLQVTATDGGTNPSGVAKFLYNINGTSLTEGGSGEQSIPAVNGSATIPRTPPSGAPTSSGTRPSTPRGTRHRQASTRSSSLPPTSPALPATWTGITLPTWPRSTAVATSSCTATRWPTPPQAATPLAFCFPNPWRAMPPVRPPSPGPCSPTPAVFRG
ncbi:hypothetical protein GXW82_21310 [Streptacidiphilus sp. 4-A2]|nr:hypothetical protein [Streptacidiphilus sp. 4-A2]